MTSHQSLAFQYIAIGVLLIVFPILDVDALKLGGEAGELVDAFDEGAEVVDRRFRPDLAGVDAEDAGRIGERTFERDASFGFGEVDELAMTADVFSFCRNRAHGIRRQVLLLEEARLEGLDVSLLIEVVHFLAESSDGIAFVVCLIVLVDEREDFFHRRIGIDEGFEGDKGIDEAVEFFF